VHNQAIFSDSEFTTVSTDISASSKCDRFFNSVHHLVLVQGSESVDSVSPHLAASQDHRTEFIPLDKLLSSPSDDDNNGKS
jgi:hypothetical protein